MMNRITVLLDNAQLEALREAAAATGLSLSAYLRTLFLREIAAPNPGKTEKIARS